MKQHIFVDNEPTISYLKCRECGETFAFTPDEQIKYEKLGFTTSPSRCPSCRPLWKAYKSVIADEQADEVERKLAELEQAIALSEQEAKAVTIKRKTHNPLFAFFNRKVL